jgi:hypothetical protein
MSPTAERPRDDEDRRDRRIDLLPGGRYVGIPQNAVTNGYHAVPSRSAKFNTKRDIASTRRGTVNQDGFGFGLTNA